MSLIKVRRDRKRSWIDAKKGLPVRTLVFLLILVLLAIWFLSTRF